MLLSARRCLPGALLLAAVALGGCVGAPSTASKSANRVYLNEAFASTETFSRVFTSPVTGTCEAARRALLSQGYVITSARSDAVNGRKSFQPEAEVHVQIEFHIVCVPEVTPAASAASDPPSTIAFVNAVQDRYSLKKNPNSASLGVSAIGSLSLPVSSSDDSLVKVASETIPAGAFYDRFFSLIERYLDAP
ncbi:DUF2242 domain-containing protein [Sphaerotilus sp.]|uniref:DUF2242 domain-containing protein n=1 Tax=Sphaerotilus sp. TaxID=2093942 RepID=UPI002ACEF201|nr:DUF2242 domain-containing protein [Sphaerotilus sp.]MDZ7858339.1 DUF2242 domain-containing protein [Sphaerotilus sp.]